MPATRPNLSLKPFLFAFFALSLSWLSLPSQADAQKFLSNCGGQRVRGLFMGAMCKKYPGKTIVRCNRRCSRRKFFKCKQWSWRRVAKKRCPQATPKRCGRKTIHLSLRNSGRRPIYFKGAIYKVRGTIYRPAANGLAPPYKGLTQFGVVDGVRWQWSNLVVLPGRTGYFSMPANLKMGCHKRRKLKVLFSCYKKGGNFSAVKRVFVGSSPGVFRFYANANKRNCAGYIDATNYNFRQLVRSLLPKRYR